MTRVIRHDPVTLSSGVKEDDFEKFMVEELIPLFSEHYKGPTRVSVADLKAQSLLKKAQRPGEYLWVTEWDGSPESVQGSSFENTRMVSVGATEGMLKKLATFGNREPETVLSEIATIEVATNT